MATLPSTEQSSRIVTLDIIRGVAVMGIFSVNVIAFAMVEAAYFNPSAYGGATGADLIVWVANMLVVDGKMRTLFSMLFGASMLLVIERAEAAGESGWNVHFRRMIVLLGFGLVHYYFIWFGDILTLYAVAGLVAFLFREMAPKKLVIIGAALLAGHMLLFTGFLIYMQGVEAAAHAPGASGEAVRDWNDGLGALAPSAAEIAKENALHLGSFWGIAADKLSEWWGIIASTLIFLPNTVGLMLLGMAGYKSGFLTGQWQDSVYRRIAGWALAVGLVGGVGVVAIDLATRFDVFAIMGAFVIADTPFITVMAFGYAALVILLSRRHGVLAQRIAAAGRCAFSNYLGTSILATLIFYGWGFGLYGSLSRWQAWLVAPAVWSVMLLWSKPWLARFHYGPLEWAWRSLSRGRMQPFRKRKPALAVSKA
ncbi:MAG TPA: DUF418 domain-containing protein [Sphingomicrobium sp.]|nr:DUF418 domain-containing protein [Sphingomicrobium sp.]